MTEGGELPDQVAAFLLVGRIVSEGEGSEWREGVVKYYQPTFGKGQQHIGFPCSYPAKEGSKKETPMDTDFRYTVMWQDGEVEVLSLEEVQDIATEEWTEEAWLPLAIRKLQQDNWGGEWEQLTGDNAVQFLKQARLEADKAEKAAAAQASKKAKKGGGAAAPSSGPKAPPRQKAAAGKKQSKEKGKQPLGKPSDDLGAQLQAAREAKKRKLQAAAAAAAASGEAASPAAKKSRLQHLLNPVRGAAAQPAAAAAGLVPSGGQGSPAEVCRLDHAGSNAGLLVAGAAAGTLAGTKARRQQQQGESESRVVGSAGKQQAAGKGKAAAAGGSSKARARPAPAPAPAATASPSKAPAASKGKQTLLTSPAKSMLSNGGGRAAPAVLRQHEMPALAPGQSDRLARAEWRDDCAKVMSASGDYQEVYWFDRVEDKDGSVLRVWSETLVVPEALCFRAKSDKRLRSWKVKAQEEDAEYVVEALLAEAEDEDGEVSYFAKWRGYEVDPGDGGWLTEAEMDHCRGVLLDWHQKGRHAWQKACRSLRQQAGLA